ncbi:MAG: cadherin-like beta sandwich domain-containing protein [Paludibacter sp.]
MKKNLFSMALIMLFNVTGLRAADVLTLGNANFETAWTNLTDYGTPTVILKKASTIASDVTGWTGDVGNGSLAIYQGSGHTGNNAAVLINISPTGGCRFYNNSVMTLTKGGQYKLTFYARGSATIGNVSLFQSGARPTIGQATSGNAGGVYDATKTINSAVSFGSIWTKQEYYFTVPISSAYTDYKLYFTFYGCIAPALDGSNLSSAFMIDDITFEPYVDNTVCTLTGITVGGKAVNNFNANTISYTVLTNNSSISTVAAIPTDARATVVVSDPVTVGNTSTVNITVTAADNTTNKIYTLVFTITNDGIIEGFGSDVVPTGWTMSQTMTGGDWLIDTGSSYNNGLYLGINSLRIKGGGTPSLTSGWLLIPNVDLPDVMTFYMKARDVATCTLSVYKRPTSAEAFTGLTGWTLCSTFTAPFDALFTQKTVSISNSERTDILLYVEKDDTKIPFALDDMRITKKDTATGTYIPKLSNLKFYTSKGKLSFQSEESVNYSVKSLTGSTLKIGRGNNVSVTLPQGCYILETNGVINKFLIP